jgi:hypothetical protein
MSIPSRDLAAVEDYTTLSPMVRAHLTAKLENVLEAMEPYLDGTFELSPRMVEVYLRALRELGLLYRVYDPPRAPDPREGQEMEPQLALEARRNEVLASLEELATRTRG